MPRQGDCYVASVGAVQCLAVCAMGAFASGWAEGRVLTTPHTLEYVGCTTMMVHVRQPPINSNDVERRRMQHAFDGPPPALGPLTRVLGMTALKPGVSAEPTVVRLPLTADTQQLVLVSPALAELASPMQCALCLHYYSQYCERQERAHAAGLAVTRGSPLRVARDDALPVGTAPAASFLLVRCLGLLAERSRALGLRDVGDIRAKALGCVRPGGAGVVWSATLL